MTDVPADTRPTARSAEHMIALVDDLIGQEEFAATLFGGVAPEDVARYEPRELAAFAAAAWAFLAERRAGEPKIRITNPPPLGGDRHKTISIIEIVNDNMPFLVDSVLAELAERQIDLRLVAHPVINVTRDAGGRLIAFSALMPQQSRESFIHLHVERIDEEAQRTDIVVALGEVLGEVRRAVADWKPMLARAGELITDLKNNPSLLPAEEISEAIAFLEWLVADNFTFLGMREYAITGDQQFEPRHDTDLGVLRHRELRVLRRGHELISVTPEILAFLQEPQALIIIKSNVRSHVHRRVYMDYIGVKRHDPQGRLIGESRIIGLFTSTAYTRPARSIPYLRRKIESCDAAGWLPARRPFRQGAGKRAGDLSARRAVSNRRGTALSICARNSLFGRAPTRAGASSLRPLRPVCLGCGLRAARSLRQCRPEGDRKALGRSVRRPHDGRAALLSGRPAGPRSFHHRRVVRA